MARPPTRANTAPEPGLEHDAEALGRPARARTAPVARHTEPTRDRWATHPWRRSPRLREPWDAPDQVESTLSASASTCPSLSASTQRWGWTPSCNTPTALDNAKDGLEEDVAGILDDQSAAERDMAELRAEQDRYGESLELALQKQQRVVDSLLHLVEDMSGRLKRLEEL